MDGEPFSTRSRDYQLFMVSYGYDTSSKKCHEVEETFTALLRGHFLDRCLAGIAGLFARPLCLGAHGWTHYPNKVV